MLKLTPFLLCILVLSNVYSQQYQQLTYTSQDGLPATYVLTGIVRSNGELILGTTHGISRFNGQTFINYDYDSGLPNLMIRSLFEDSKQRLWIGTDRGICLFNEKQMIRYEKIGQPQPEYVFNFCEFENKIWAACSNGVFVFNNKEWIRKEIDSSFFCSSIKRYKQGLLFNFFDRLVYLEQGKLIHLVQSASKIPFNVFQVSGDSIFYLYGNEIFLRSTDGVTRSVYKPSKKLNIINFFLDKGKLILFTENNGVYFFDLLSKKLILQFDIKVPQDLIINKDLIWVTSFGGLTKIIARNNVLIQTTPPAINNHLQIADRNAQRTYIFGPPGRDFFRIYQSNDSIRNVLFRGGSYDGAEFLFDKGCSGRSDEIFLISRLGHFQKLSFRTKTTEFPLDMVRAYDVSYDSVGKLLYVSTINGVYILDNNHIKDSLKISGVYAARACSRGGLLYYSDGKLSLYRNGVIKTCLQVKSPVFRKWDVNIEESNSGLVSLTVKGAGIRLYKWRADSLIEYGYISKEAGLRNNSILKSVFDRNMHLWILSEAGLSVVDLKNKVENLPALRNFGSLGFAVNNWEQCTIGVSHDDKLILATPSGSAFIDTKSIEIVEKPIPTYIEFVEVPGKNRIQTSLKTFYGQNNIKLNINENSFRIKYQAVSYTGAGDIIYSYRLQGSSQSDWSEPTALSSVSFLSLPAGKYTFELKARKPNTPWSASVVLQIEITPPFWQARWFQMLMLVNLFLLLWFGFQLRLRKVRKDSFLKAKLADLEMKALRAQMNPHFIYNALNSIQSLIATGNQKDAMRYVSKFGKLLRLILERSEEGKTSLQKEIDVNSLYIELEQLRLGFDFEIEINISDEIIPEDEKVPALIMQPVIENALWHGLTNINDDKKLIIDITTTRDYIVIGVTDNGPGLIQTSLQSPNSSEKRKSFGSQIVRKRLLTYNNDNKEPVHIRDLKEIGKRGTEVKIFIRRFAG